MSWGTEFLSKGLTPSSAHETARLRVSVQAEGVEAVEAAVVKAAPPQTLALKPTSGPMGIAKGVIIRPRPGPAGVSGDSGPAPI